MARIRISMPATRIFETRINVRITDINYGNHLGNDALVSLLHDVRMQWLRTGGFTELSIGGAGLIMSDLAVEYKAESFYGDELVVSLAADDIKNISFDLVFEISTLRSGETIHIANAKTGMVCYDYATKKVTALPGIFRRFLQAGD